MRRWKMMRSDGLFFEQGEIVTLRRDDGSDCPFFDGKWYKGVFCHTDCLVEIDRNGKTIRTYKQGDTLNGGKMVSVTSSHEKVQYACFVIDLSAYKEEERKVMSAAVQKHAFSLGYKWHSGDTGVLNTGRKFLFFDEDRTIYYSDEYGSAWAVVSVEDFLKMGRPLLNNEPADIVCADFSWIKGTARKVLFDKIIADNTGYTSCLDGFLGMPSWVYIDKKRRHIYAEGSSKGVQEITCNKMLEGKF